MSQNFVDVAQTYAIVKKRPPDERRQQESTADAVDPHVTMTENELYKPSRREAE